MQALNLLRVVAHAKWGSDEATLLHLYRSLIRSKLDYSTIVYGSARVIPSYAVSDPESGTTPLLGCISNIASHKLTCGSKRDAHGTSKETARITILAQDMLKYE